MVEANCIATFIGIESPDEDTLREGQKVPERAQGRRNARGKVHRIQNAGMEVWCRMIIGFDQR